MCYSMSLRGLRRWPWQSQLHHSLFLVLHRTPCGGYWIFPIPTGGSTVGCAKFVFAHAETLAYTVGTMKKAEINKINIFLSYIYEGRVGWGLPHHYYSPNPSCCHSERNEVKRRISIVPISAESLPGSIVGCAKFVFAHAETKVTNTNGK